MFFLVLLFLLYFNGSFIDISNFISLFLTNDVGYNFDLFEDWVLSFNYLYVIYTIFLFFPKFFLFSLNFLENIFLDNLSSFCKSDIILTYDYFSLNVASISVFTETLTNLIFFKLNYLVSSLLNFEINLDKNFLYNNPIFFYSGFLFLFSTLLSLVLMSYLGLYGVFITNLITLFTL